MAEHPSLHTLIWTGAQASGSLTLASAAWWLSGLSPSPLLNGLMPALAGAATLLPWRARPGLGLALQLLALIALLGVSGLHLRTVAAPLRLVALVLTLLATLVWTIGRQLSLPALRDRLHARLGLSERLLRGGGEAGRLLGTLLAGLLFPLGRALAQFTVAVVLLLPLLPAIRTARCSLGAPTRTATDQPDPPAGDGATPDGASIPWPRTWGGRTARAAHATLRGELTLGLLFGALFALLPLWVRQQGRGTCFDFGMLLSAFTVGRLVADLPLLRTAASRLFRWRAGSVPLGLMALLLLLSQRIPGWGAVSLFVPFGVLAGLLEQELRPDLPPTHGLLSVPADLDKARTLGGLIGTLTMGLITQAIGLFWAWPLQVLAFAMAALTWRPVSSHNGPSAV